MEYKIKPRSDYDGRKYIKTENITVEFYTKKQIKNRYPNHNYKVMGEIGNKKGTPVGAAESSDGQVLPIYETGTHYKLIERTNGYAAVDAHSFLAVVGSVFTGINKYLVALCTAAVIIIIVLIGATWFYNPTARMAGEVISAIDAAEQSKVGMITINNKFTVTQNGKANININQGVYIKDDTSKQVAISAALDFTSELNPANNYNLILDIWKKDNKIFEKQGSRYEESDITASEFNDAVKDYKIYRIKKSDIKDIEEVKSVDGSSVIYQITLNKLDESLIVQYLTSISEQVGEKFTEENIRKTNAVIVANITSGVLKSQQLKFYLEIRSVTNAIEMANVSEINVSLDEKTIQNNFLGRIKS